MKNDVRGAIAPRTFQAVEHASVRKAFEPFDSDRRARTIADQTFQTFAVGTIQRNVCMEAESIHVGAARTGECVHTLRIDLISGARCAAAGIGAERGSAQDGRLTDWVSRRGEHANAAVLVLSGIGGVGKTNLTGFWAKHDVADMELPGYSEEANTSGVCVTVANWHVLLLQGADRFKFAVGSL